MKRFIAFSGGIDSTALALIEKDAVPVFTDTGWEFDELYQHIVKFEKATGRKVIRIKSKHGSLPEYIRKRKFLPGHASRFCTRMFKIEPFNEFLQDKKPAELLIGLRADEEERTGNLTIDDGIKIRYPLREMGLTRIDCVKICIENDLLPRYPVYMARGGCKGCFYKRKSEVLAMIHLIPEEVKKLMELEESVQDERGKFAVMFPNIGIPIRELMKQPSLFDMKEVYESARHNEDYGLACGLFCNR